MATPSRGKRRHAGSLRSRQIGLIDDLAVCPAVVPPIPNRTVLSAAGHDGARDAIGETDGLALAGRMACTKSRKCAERHLRRRRARSVRATLVLPERRIDK